MSRIAVIADDHGMYRMGLAFTLKDRLGFDDVEEAASLDEALSRLGDTDGIALAIFDLSMPGMQSAASLAAVRECYPDLPIAVVSGSDSRTDVLAALAAGVNGFVPKGLKDDDLVAALRTILGGAIYVPATLAQSTGHAAEPASSASISPGSRRASARCWTSGRGPLQQGDRPRARSRPWHGEDPPRRGVPPSRRVEPRRRRGHRGAAPRR